MFGLFNSPNSSQSHLALVNLFTIIYKSALIVKDFGELSVDILLGDQLSKAQFDHLSKRNIPPHKYAIAPRKSVKNPKLSQFFRLLSSEFMGYALQAHSS